MLAIVIPTHNACWTPAVAINPYSKPDAIVKSKLAILIMASGLFHGNGHLNSTRVPGNSQYAVIVEYICYRGGLSFLISDIKKLDSFHT